LFQLSSGNRNSAICVQTVHNLIKRTPSM